MCNIIIYVFTVGNFVLQATMTSTCACYRQILNLDIIYSFISIVSLPLHLEKHLIEYTTPSHSIGVNIPVQECAAPDSHRFHCSHDVETCTSCGANMCKSSIVKCEYLSLGVNPYYCSSCMKKCKCDFVLECCCPDGMGHAVITNSPNRNNIANCHKCDNGCQRTIVLCDICDEYVCRQHECEHISKPKQSEKKRRTISTKFEYFGRRIRRPA